MAFLGGLFASRRPSQAGASLFGDVMAGAQPDPTLAALGAATGAQGPFSGPSRLPPVVGTGTPDYQPAAAQSRTLVPAGGRLPGLRLSDPSSPQPDASAAPAGSDLARQIAYAHELGIPVGEKHKFSFGKALAGFFLGAPVAQALLAGDYARAGQLNIQGQQLAASRYSRAPQAASELHQLSVYAALRDSGVPKNDAIIALTNMDKLGENFNTRYRTDDIAPGHTRSQPNLDGSVSSYTAPNLVQHGADYQFVTPSADGPSGLPPVSPDRVGPPGLRASSPPDQAPMLPAPPDQAMLGGVSIPGASGPPAAPTRPALPPGIPPGAGLPPSAPMLGNPRANVVAAGSLRTDAEQYADTLYDRGSPQWRSAVQDAMLKANGPTAFRQDQQLQGARLGVQMRGQDIDQGNNVRTTSTSAANNLRSTNASMANNRNRPAAVGVDANGNTTLVYPDNRVVTTHGIHPVSSVRGRGRLGGAVSPQEGMTATGPGGQKLVLRGGQWVDPRTGAPVR